MNAPAGSVSRRPGLRRAGNLAYAHGVTDHRSGPSFAAVPIPSRGESAPFVKTELCKTKDPLPFLLPTPSCLLLYCISNRSQEKSSCICM